MKQVLTSTPSFDLSDEGSANADNDEHEPNATIVRLMSNW
jgi:hypothetical protein